MSNAYDSTRGNTTDRNRRRRWLLETYAADTRVRPRFGVFVACEPDHPEAVAACRCYRCGTLLTLETLTVDRIIPGCKGGTYRRSNIRPSCSDCANRQGGELGAKTR